MSCFELVGHYELTIIYIIFIKEISMSKLFDIKNTIIKMFPENAICGAVQAERYVKE